MKKLKQSQQSINYDNCPIWNDDYFWWLEEDSIWTDDNFYLKESDFYPLLDDRVWKSNIEDIEGGDNFADYCKELFQLLDEEDYWEN